MSCRILLLVPDGVGVRNFVLGPFLRTALKRLGPHGEIHILHGIPPALLPDYRAGVGASVHWHALAPFEDSRLAVIQRNSLAYAQMYWVDTHAMRITRDRPVRGPLRSRVALRFAKALGRAAATPQGIRVLDRWHCATATQAPAVAHYRKLFEEIRPDVLFCSHQRPPEILAPVLAARKLEIPTATFIFSWDNLTSKGRIAAPFGHYLVWSDLMHSEIRKYYPDVPANRIHVVGTPQFDPYGDLSLLWSRQEFFERIGADPARPLICYSGGDPGNAPQDPLHLTVLMDQIRSGEIAHRPQVLLRPMPVDDGKRYAGVRSKYPELIYAPADWVQSESGYHAAAMPRAGDVQFLANLTRHADLNVNFASTMTLDFGLHDRPVVNVAFDVNEQWYGLPLFDYIRRFEHYRCVYDLGAARFARSREELALHVNAYLDNPALDREGRRKLVELQTGAPVGCSTGLVIDALQSVAARVPEKVAVGV